MIELDGGIHASQVDADRERQYVLERLGLHVIGFSNEAVLLDLGTVVDSILAAARLYSKSSDNRPEAET